jgi:flagellar motor component MotA
MDIASFVGFLLSHVLVLVAMGDPTIFLDFQAAVIVVGGTIGLMLFSFPLQTTLSASRYFGYAFIPPKPGADNSNVIGELEIGIVYFEKMKSYAQATGWVGFLIGLVLILANLNDPAKIGPGAAIALLTVFYGTIVAYFYCMPISTKLQCRLDELKKAS